MKNNRRFTESAVFALLMFVAIVSVEYILDATGITRACYQWWTDWSGIDFVGMLDYMYSSAFYHVCAWTAIVTTSVGFGASASLVYDELIG